MSDERPLTHLFLDGLSATLKARMSHLSHLEGVLRDILESARGAWPTIDLAAQVFLPYLAQRLPEDAEAERALLEVKAADLYLACACSRRDAEALAAFERLHFPEIKTALMRRDPTFGQVEDIQQILFQKLFLGDEQHPPKIASYAGRGDLRGWLCVTAVRESIDLLRKVRREAPVEDNVLIDLAAPAGDQEMAYLKRVYREEFKAAFQHALAALTTRERNVLRHHLLDGLNIDQIGAIYSVHRATVARRIAHARETLLSATRTALMEKLRVDQTEFESIMRLIQSRLDISIHQFLKKDDE
jgi:RNA polymerase sigma-70 factor (ECF subfamily)